MKSNCSVGEIRILKKVVSNEDLATFETGNVHPFYSTFSLGRDVEWACRQFVLEMKDENEEGIGTFVNILHKSPAKIGEKVLFTATVKSIIRNEIICTITAETVGRVIAEIETGQKILSKEKLKTLLS